MWNITATPVTCAANIKFIKYRLSTTCTLIDEHIYCNGCAGWIDCCCCINNWIKFVD